MSMPTEDTICRRHVNRLTQAGGAYGRAVPFTEVTRSVLLQDHQFRGLRSLLQRDPSKYDLFVSTAFKCLGANDSEVRLAAVRLIDVFFCKVHVVRQSVVDDLQTIVLLCLESNPVRYPLPPPKEHAAWLKMEAAQILAKWNHKYAPAYRQLALKYEVISSQSGAASNRDNVESLSSPTPASELDQVATDRQNRLAAQIIHQIDDQHKTLAAQLKDVLCEFDNGTEILLPNWQSLTQHKLPANTPTLQNESTEDVSLSINKTVCVNWTGFAALTPDDHNADLIQAITDCTRMLKVGIMPKLDRLVQNTQRVSHTNDGRLLLERLEQSQTSCERALCKANELGIRIDTANKQTVDDEDDEMEEVIAKYDAYFQEEPEPDLMAIAACTQTSTSQNRASNSDLANEPSCSYSQNNTDYYGCAQIPPNVLISPKKEESTDIESSETQPPALPFGLDLKYWGSTIDHNSGGAAGPSMLRNDSDCQRVGRPTDCEIHEPSCSSAVYNSRLMPFTGSFERVLRECRAPQGNNKVCLRMDRYKCPFHGLIKDRRPDGTLASADNDSACSSNANNAVSEGQPWLDPTLMKDIETATGHKLDYGVTQTNRRGARKRAHARRRPAPPAAATRNRLSSKLLAKSTVRRVTATLDRMQKARNERKFAHQYTYAISDGKRIK